LTDFVVTITDQASLDGITWAREQYNASLPPPPPPLDTVTGGMATPEGVARPERMMPAPMPMADAPAPIETDQEYVQWVMSQAAISYADQKLRDEYRQYYENATQAQAQAAARR
jgi:hypothetical protein